MLSYVGLGIPLASSNPTKLGMSFVPAHYPATILLNSIGMNSPLNYYSIEQHLHQHTTAINLVKSICTPSS